MFPRAVLRFSDALGSLQAGSALCFAGTPQDLADFAVASRAVITKTTGTDTQRDLPREFHRDAWISLGTVRGVISVGFGGGKVLRFVRVRARIFVSLSSCGL